MPVFEVFADDTIKSYRNNESKFEVDPDNNQIRLRDHSYVSGQLHVSGAAAGDYGSVHITGGGGYAIRAEGSIRISEGAYGLYMPGDISHMSSNYLTRFGFDGADTWRVMTNNNDRFRITNTSVSVNQDEEDVDFIVNGDGAGDIFYVDGATHVVGIGAAPTRTAGLQITPTVNTTAFIAFEGTTIANNTRNIDTTDSTSTHSADGFVKILINGNAKWLRYYNN